MNIPFRVITFVKGGKCFLIRVILLAVYSFILTISPLGRLIMLKRFWNGNFSWILIYRNNPKYRTNMSELTV